MPPPDRSLGLFAVAVLACGPTTPASSSAGTTAEGSTSTSSGSTSVVGESSTSTGAGSTAGESPTPTTGSTGAPCDSEEPPTCEPGRQEMVLDFRLDAKGRFDDDQEDYVEACTVMSAAIEMADLALTFVCMDAADQVTVHEIRVTLDPPPLPPPLMPGEEVTLRVYTDVFFEGSERRVAVHDTEGELVLAFVDRGWAGPEFFAPLAIELASVCPPVCADPDCGFILPDCPCDERQAIDLKAGDELLLRVVDGNVGLREEPPRYQMRVERALSSGPSDDPGSCESPYVWRHFLILRVP